VLRICHQVVLPLAAGQWLRARHHSVGDYVDAWKPQLGTLASFTLLVIIYTTFCNTFCQVCVHHESPLGPR
jgi:predicted Na+-dependent transporter